MNSSIVVVINLRIDVVPSGDGHCQFSILVLYAACNMTVRGAKRPVFGKSCMCKPLCESPEIGLELISNFNFRRTIKSKVYAITGCGDKQLPVPDLQAVDPLIIDTLDVSRGFVWILKRNEKKHVVALYYHFKMDRKFKLISSNSRFLCVNDADQS